MMTREEVRSELTYDFFFKVLLLGEAGTGKSSFQTRFIDGFFPTNTRSTLGFEFKYKRIRDSNGWSVKLQMFDTAGCEKFQSVTTNYYRGVHYIIVFYAVNNRKSFESLDRWFSRIEVHADDKVPVMLVGNKVDVDDRKVSYDEGDQVARKFNVPFYETSVLSGYNVNNSMCEVVTELVNQSVHNREDLLRILNTARLTKRLSVKTRRIILDFLGLKHKTPKSFGAIVNASVGEDTSPCRMFTCCN
jgi:small GTP-binding protein